MCQWIREAHPGTEVIPLKVFEGPQSLAPLMQQVNRVSEALRELARARPDVFAAGYHLVCHSQGAVVCRVLCETMEDHQVHTLVSLAGPHLGVYGATWFKHAATLVPGLGVEPVPLGPFPIPFEMEPILDLAYRNFYAVAYTPLLQSTLSVANLWNDPFHHQEFLTGNAFLPEANGLAAPGEERARFRVNFLRLQKAVFLTGRFENRSYDSPLGLEPWQSGIFGFYARDSESKVVPLENQPVYVEDTFGLKSLDMAGRLHVEAVEGVGHGAWVRSRDVFKQYVLPHLT